MTPDTTRTARETQHQAGASRFGFPEIQQPMKSDHPTPSVDSNPAAQPTPIEVMQSWFDEVQLPYNFFEEDNMISSGIAMTNLEVGIVCRVLPDGDRVLIVRHPMRAPKETRHAVGEFLLRLNHASKQSHWEMDFDDGEVRFRSVTSTPEVEFSKDYFRLWLAEILLVTDAVCPYLAGVFGRTMKPDFAADQAIAAIEESFRKHTGE
jgi:hypothetical protein